MLLALALGGAILASPSAQANVIFDLTLTPTSGTAAGTGVLSFTGPIDPSFESIGPGPSSLIDLFTITLGGHFFDLTNSFTNVTFTDGALSNIGVFALDFPYFLATSDTTYTFSNLSSGENAIGQITANEVVTSAVPELSTWAMMLVGFTILGLVGYRRRRNVAVISA